MSRSIHILFATLVVFCLQQEIKAAVVPEKQENNLEILLVSDIEKYQKNNPDVKLKAFENVENVGHTFGVQQEGDIVLFNIGGIAYIDRDFDHMSYPLRYPREFEIEITYVELHFVDNVNGGKAFVIEGGIGQNLISLLVETPSESQGSVSFVTLVYGKAVEN